MSDCTDFHHLLTPLVDGELDATDRARAEAHLAACPSCRADAWAEREGRAVVRAGASRLAVTAPASLVARCESLRPDARAQAAAPSRLRGWVPLSLAATLVLAVGGAFVFSLNTPVSALATQLTLDHLKCFALTDDTASTATAGEVADLVARVCGRPVSVPGDLPAEGFRLVGARRCLSTHGQLAHVLYELNGHPVSLFVLAGGSNGDQKSEIMGHHTVWWRQGDATYALVSRAADGTIGTAAAIVQRATR